MLESEVLLEIALELFTAKRKSKIQSWNAAFSFQDEYI